MVITVPPIAAKTSSKDRRRRRTRRASSFRRRELVRPLSLVLRVRQGDGEAGAAGGAGVTGDGAVVLGDHPMGDG